MTSSMNTPTVLLVEDNPDDADLTVRAFRDSRENVRIVVVRDGVEAIDFLFGNRHSGSIGRSALPSLILLDLKLPKVSGLEVLRRIRADSRTRLLPVIILTSSREEIDIVAGYGAGANSYIRKPVEFGAFRKAMRDVRNYWLDLAELPPPTAPTRTV